MKNSAKLFALCAAAVLLSCSKAKTDQAATTADSLTTDSTTALGTAPTPIPAADTIFHTPDLTLFELMGHVKTCKQGDAELTFDRDGNLTSYTIDGLNQLANIKREKGRLVQYIGQEEAEIDWADEHYVEWNDDNSVKVYTQVNMEGGVEYTYTYGTADGDVAALPRIVSSLRVGEGYNWSGITTYTYQKFDDHHNWLERKAKDEFFCDYDGHQEYNETTAEKRTISYWF